MIVIMYDVGRGITESTRILRVKDNADIDLIIENEMARFKSFRNLRILRGVEDELHR